jgi:hypothetical protein
MGMLFVGDKTAIVGIVTREEYNCGEDQEMDQARPDSLQYWNAMPCKVMLQFHIIIIM